MQGKGFVVEASTRSERVQEIDKWYGDPWYVALGNLNTRLERLDPGYTIVQIKEKFGELRFYYQPSKPGLRERMDREVRNAERQCWETDQLKKNFDQNAVPAPHPHNAPEW